MLRGMLHCGKILPAIQGIARSRHRMQQADAWTPHFRWKCLRHGCCSALI